MSRVRQAAKTKYMRKCRNWQTSKTKDLVIIAIVWVQVPSSALNNKTGTKQSVWSLSYCSKPKRALTPWFKVSPPARSARGMRSPGPHSPHLAQDYGRGRAGPMGPRSPLRFGRCRTDVPRTSCNPSSARLRLLRGRRPWFKVSPPARSARGMRSPGPHSVSAPVVAGQALYNDKTGKEIFL